MHDPAGERRGTCKQVEAEALINGGRFALSITLTVGSPASVSATCLSPPTGICGAMLMIADAAQVR